MSIKEILDEIAAESSTNQKMVILAKYKDNELLKRVIYLAHSKRVKFHSIYAHILLNLIKIFPKMKLKTKGIHIICYSQR